MKKLIFILLCFCLMTFGSSAKIIEVAPAGAWGVLGISGGGAVVGGGDVSLAGTLQTVDAAAFSGSDSITIDADADICVVLASFYYNYIDATFDPFVAIGGALGGVYDITELQKSDYQTGANQIMIGYILQSTIGGTGTQTLYWQYHADTPPEYGGQILVQCFDNVNTGDPIDDSDINVVNDQDVTSLTVDAGDMMIGIMGSDGDMDVSGSSQSVLADSAYGGVYYGVAYKLSASTFDVASGTLSSQAALTLNKAP